MAQHLDMHSVFLGWGGPEDLDQLVVVHHHLLGVGLRLEVGYQRVDVLNALVCLGPQVQVCGNLVQAQHWAGLHISLPWLQPPADSS